MKFWKSLISGGGDSPPQSTGDQEEDQGWFFSFKINSFFFQTQDLFVSHANHYLSCLFLTFAATFVLENINLENQEIFFSTVRRF